MSHDDTLLPLALTTAVIGLLLFGSAWALCAISATLR
jgi:hypothetical protein